MPWICKDIFVTWYIVSKFELSNENVTTVCIPTEVSDFAVVKIHKKVSMQFLLQGGISVIIIGAVKQKLFFSMCKLTFIF